MNLWLAATLPVQTELEQEQETRLARRLAADQLYHQIEQLQHFWNGTSDPKYLRQQTRVITALARLGIVPGAIDALAADACQDNATARAREGEAPAEPVACAASSQSEICNLKSAITSPPPSGACSPPRPEQENSNVLATDSSAASLALPPASDNHKPVLEPDLDALNLLEKRLLALLEAAPPGDLEKRGSLETTLGQTRQQQSALLMRISPDRPGIDARNSETVTAVLDRKIPSQGPSAVVHVN